MRIAYLILCVTVLAMGALFGALNPQPVLIDFYFSAHEMRLGLGLLLAALAGSLLGGICVWAGVVVPLRRKLARHRRESGRQARDLVPTPNHEPLV